MIIKELKISNMDICLSSVICYMHKEQKEIYINKVLDNYETLYKRGDKKLILQKIKWLKNNGFIKYYYKDSRYGKIPAYIMVTDKLLMLHRLSMLVVLLRQDEKNFNELAEPTLKKILDYIKMVKRK